MSDHQHTMWEPHYVSIPFKREGVSELIREARALEAKYQEVSIPFKREGVSEQFALSPEQ